MCQDTLHCVLRKSQAQLKALRNLVLQASEKERADEVERDLFVGLLPLGRTLLQAFVNQAGVSFD